MGFYDKRSGVAEVPPCCCWKFYLNHGASLTDPEREAPASGRIIYWLYYECFPSQVMSFFPVPYVLNIKGAKLRQTVTVNSWDWLWIIKRITMFFKSVYVNNGKIATCRHIWIGSLSNPIMMLTRPRLGITGRWAYWAASFFHELNTFSVPSASVCWAQCWAMGN